MRLLKPFFTTALLLSLAGGCSTQSYDQPQTQQQTQSQRQNQCQFGDVTIAKNFEAGRFSECREVEPGHYELVLVPENTPINHSPWYAFKVSSTKPQAVNVTLIYSHHKHRYWPKQSQDRRQWQRLATNDVKISQNKKRATFTLQASPNPLWVAAQPIINNKDYSAWLDTLATKNTGLILSDLGQSVEGRPLQMLQSQADAKAPLLVFLGRQHPPEVTGAIAMLHFVERLLADDPLAVEFRQHFNLLIVPNMNPDGVAAGNWRHNSHGVDLNRDWGPFNQPETRQVKAAIDQVAVTEQIWNVVDFHSTAKNVFYTQKDDMTNRFPTFTSEWMAGIGEQVPGFTLHRSGAHNAGMPTSKTYFYETGKVPAITYEMGDETPLATVHKVAVAAAEQYMNLWLARKPRA